MRGQDADVSHLLPGDVGEAEEVEGGSGGTGTGRRCAETHSDEDDLAAQRALAPDERAHARDVVLEVRGGRLRRKVRLCGELARRGIRIVIGRRHRSVGGPRSGSEEARQEGWAGSGIAGVVPAFLAEVLGG